MLRPAMAVIAPPLILSARASAGADTPLNKGRPVYGNVCSAYRGNTGQRGVGHVVAGVTETYGALDRPVAAGMPSHTYSLTPEQIAAVTARERSTCANVSEETAIDDCGVEACDG